MFCCQSRSGPAVMLRTQRGKTRISIDLVPVIILPPDIVDPKAWGLSYNNESNGSDIWKPCLLAPVEPRTPPGKNRWVTLRISLSCVYAVHFLLCRRTPPDSRNKPDNHLFRLSFPKLDEDSLRDRGCLKDVIRALKVKQN